MHREFMPEPDGRRLDVAHLIPTMGQKCAGFPFDEAISPDAFFWGLRPALPWFSYGGGLSRGWYRAAGFSMICGTVF
nr:hypothetical protein [Desulfobacter latus]